jgi:hypothetical protein
MSILPVDVVAILCKKTRTQLLLLLTVNAARKKDQKNRHTQKSKLHQLRQIIKTLLLESRDAHLLQLDGYKRKSPRKKKEKEE